MSEWRPIETAPRDVEALFYVRAGTQADGRWFCDTSGNPILGQCRPRIMLTHYARWSSLEVATHWMPLPEHPTVTGNPT